MTKYAFVTDQRKRIGCHARTVACKQENGHYGNDKEN